MSTPQDPTLIATGTPTSFAPVSDTNPFPVKTTSGSNPSVPYSAQATVGVVAAALAAQAITSGVILKADVNNTGDIYVGPPGVTTATGYQLKPKDTVPVNVSNMSGIAAIATVAGQKLYILGS